ncbi:MAG: hypothetical protein LBQ55_07665 [Treponema sp.]|nr:hypothetical protein [Treponema sp.]
MKRILVLLFILFETGVLLAAQEAGTAGQDAAANKKPAHWWEYLHGIDVGMEAGVHEFPLAVWYPGRYTEGYSIRSLYLMPNISYGRSIQDFHFDVNMELTIDAKGPDPSPGAVSMGGESTDRKTWVTIYLEEKMDYPISHLFPTENFPGTLSVFLNNENYIYATPDFPGGKTGEGFLELGPAAYNNDFNFGWFMAKMGLPLYYLDRYRDEFGMGLNLTVGYKDPLSLGLGAEITTRIGFVPSPDYLETEFHVTYDWKDFSAELEIIAEGAFKSAALTPEIRYRLKSFIFSLGVEISGVGKYAAFSPRLGMNWKY